MKLCSSSAYNGSTARKNKKEKNDDDDDDDGGGGGGDDDGDDGDHDDEDDDDNDDDDDDIIKIMTCRQETVHSRPATAGESETEITKTLTRIINSNANCRRLKQIPVPRVSL